MSGILRKIDDHRRILLPREICEYLLINPGDFLEFSVDEDCIKIRKPSQVKKCYLCNGVSTQFIQHNGVNICANCAESISKALD